MIWLPDWRWLTIEQTGPTMHPGLPDVWVNLVLAGMLAGIAWVLLRREPGVTGANGVSLARVPVAGGIVRRLTASPVVLMTMKLVMLAFFLVVIYAGLSGTPIPERNLATTLTWTIWWAGLVIAIFFVGTAWCAVCPWDTLANLLVKGRLFWRRQHALGLGLKVPRPLRSVWPALMMFIGLTWLELGVGVTTNPYVTALLALLMVVLATLSLAIFERKAFCRYFCPVGRTIGFYAGLSPVAVRPIDPDICARCTTLECYHGNDRVEPCPTHLVVGRLQQNTYCTSCGNCTQSCPHHNVAWRLRPVAEEVLSDVRPHNDEAWFLLGLLALTSFHGVTMLPFWDTWVTGVSTWLGERSGVIAGFSVLMAASMLVPVLLYLLAVTVTRRLTGITHGARLFSAMALATLPLAFCYHIAHNINHLVRESQGFWSVLANPLGIGARPLSSIEIHIRHLNPLIPQNLLFALQAMLILAGFWLAVRVVRKRLASLVTDRPDGLRLAMLPMLLFVAVVSLFNLWMLMQPMVMRMLGASCGTA